MTVRPMHGVLIALALVAVGGLWRAVAVEREKQRLLQVYAEAQRLASQLDAERAQLNEQLSETTRQLEQESAERAQLHEELQEVQGRLEDTAGQLDSLQQQYAGLEDANASLLDHLGVVTAEKQGLQAKFSSLKELKLAIRGVKSKIRLDRAEARRVQIVAFRETDQQALMSGNHGFVVRHGMSTLGAESALHVRVLEPETQ